MFKKKSIKKFDQPQGTDTMAIPSYFGGFGPPARFRQRKKPEDALSYDYRLARHNVPNPNSIAASVIHILMFASGPASVAAHAGFMFCGIMASLAVIITISIGISFCVCGLVWSAQLLYGRIQHPQLSYQDTAEAALLLSKWSCVRKCARAFRYIVEFTLMLHCYATCSVLLTMISRNLKEMVEGDEKLSDLGDPPLREYILYMMVPCVIVCLVSNLKFLAPFALIAVIYCFAVVTMTMWYAFHDMRLMPWERPAFKSYVGLVKLIGMSIFMMESASAALPIENNMEKPKKFHKVIAISMPIVAVVTMLIGFCGYWNYGELCFSPILVHFPFDPFPIQLKVFLCLMLYVMIAIYSYSAFDVEWFYIKRHHQQANYWFWERLYRTLHVILIVVFSYFAPNVAGMMSIIGCLFTNPVVFLYPQIIEIIVYWDYPGMGAYYWRLVKCCVIMLLSFVLMIGGTTLNVYLLMYNMQYTRDMRIQNDTDRFDTNVHVFNGDY